MRVLHLIDSGGFYGAEKMLLTLVAEQINQGLEPMILSAGELGIDEKAIEVEAVRLGLPITPWRMEPGLNRKESKKILAWASLNDYQVLHSHGYKFDILLNVFNRKRRDQAVVATVHGYTNKSLFSKLGMYRLLDRFFLRRSDGIAVVSKELKKEFENHPKVSFIPNGIARQTLPGNETVRPINEEFLLSIGRLSKEKGLETLIRAFHKLDKNRFPKNLVVAGDGPEKEQLCELVKRLNLEDNVHFLGFVDDVAPLIRNAEGLVISSLSEGLPITLLEAMRAGTLVISTPVGEIPEVLDNGNCGYLSKSTGCDDLVRALEEAFTKKNESSQKRDQAVNRYLNQYTSKRMADQYLDFYRNVCC